MRFVIAAACCAVVAACASSGVDFHDSALAQMRIGQTTEEEAAQLMGGPPNMRTTLHDGSRLLTWTFIHSSIGKVRSRSAALSFDKNGKFIQVMHASNYLQE